MYQEPLASKAIRMSVRNLDKNKWCRSRRNHMLLISTSRVTRSQAVLTSRWKMHFVTMKALLIWQVEHMLPKYKAKNFRQKSFWEHLAAMAIRMFYLPMAKKKPYCSRRGYAADRHFKWNKLSGRLDESWEDSLRDHDTCVLEQKHTEEEHFLFHVSCLKKPASNHSLRMSRSDMTYPEICRRMRLQYNSGDKDSKSCSNM